MNDSNSTNSLKLKIMMIDQILKMKRLSSMSRRRKREREKDQLNNKKYN